MDSVNAKKNERSCKAHRRVHFHLPTDDPSSNSESNIDPQLRTLPAPVVSPTPPPPQAPQATNPSENPPVDPRLNHPEHQVIGCHNGHAVLGSRAQAKSLQHVQITKAAEIAGLASRYKKRHAEEEAARRDEKRQRLLDTADWQREARDVVAHTRRYTGFDLRVAAARQGRDFVINVDAKERKRPAAGVVAARKATAEQNARDEKDERRRIEREEVLKELKEAIADLEALRNDQLRPKSAFDAFLYDLGICDEINMDDGQGGVTDKEDGEEYFSFLRRTLVDVARAGYKCKVCPAIATTRQEMEYHVLTHARFVDDTFQPDKEAVYKYLKRLWYCEEPGLPPSVECLANMVDMEGIRVPFREIEESESGGVLKRFFFRS